MNYTKLSIIALLLQSTVLFAQDSSECDYSHRWWWNVGTGIGVASNDSADFTAPAIQLSFNGMITNSMFITLAWTDIFNNNDYRNNKFATDIGALLGYKSKRPSCYWSAAAGVGAARYEREYVSYANYYSYSYTRSESL